MACFIFQLTTRCNQSCRFCYNKKGSFGPLKEICFKKYIPVINFLKKNEPIDVAIIGFGEALLYKDIDLFLKNIKNLKNFKSMTTNGSLLDFYAKDIATSINKLNISIHGLEKTHNKITKSNNFSKVIKGIEKIKKINPHIKIWINTVPCKENYREILKIVKYFLKYNVGHSFMHLQKTNASDPIEDFNTLAVNELFSIFHQVEKINPNIMHVPNISEENFKKYFYSSNK